MEFYKFLLKENLYASDNLKKFDKQLPKIIRTAGMSEKFVLNSKN